MMKSSNALPEVERTTKPDDLRLETAVVGTDSIASSWLVFSASIIASASSKNSRPSPWMRGFGPKYSGLRFSRATSPCVYLVRVNGPPDTIGASFWKVVRPLPLPVAYFAQMCSGST
jgi:hypothetical protein